MTIPSRAKLERHTLLFASLMTFLLASGLLFPKLATAISPSDWQPGNIISDGVFQNTTSMSVNDIQQFLNSKIGTCDTSGSQPSIYWNSTANRYYTHAEYGTLKGYNPPYTCINEYAENPSNGQNNFTGVSPSIINSLVPSSLPAGWESAAQIIYNAAQKYDINPEVILVTLQKEQGLVTDNWPWIYEYRFAMGYACPDTSGCNPSEAGFYTQVDGGAGDFRYYLDHNSQFNYHIGNNNVLYNPNPSCGTSSVNIQNLATAALYIYTPYQPNQAALNAGYGTGDSCSAYGNRNFWLYFNDWFGNSRGAPYLDSYAGQSAPSPLNPGTSSPAYFMYRNTGNSPWYDDTSLSSAPAGTHPVHLATSGPINRCSRFGSSWVGCARPAVNFSAVYESDGTTLASNQHVVQPGQIAKFSFSFTAPLGTLAGTYRENFRPILEGTSDGGLNDPGTWLQATINPLQKIDIISQSSDPTIAPAQSTQLSISFQNSGSMPLYDDTSLVNAPPGTKPLHLATTTPLNTPSDFSASWPSPDRPASKFSAVYNSDGTSLANNQHIAQPGQIIKYSFSVTVPPGYASGTYKLHVQPILEGSGDGYFSDTGIYWAITVPSTPVFSITNSSPSLTLVSNSPSQLGIGIKNVGNATSGINLQIKTRSGSAFMAPGWQSASSISTIPSMPAGSSTIISLPILTPAVSSTQTYSFDCSFSDNSTTIPLADNCGSEITVSPPIFASTYFSQSDWPILVPGSTASLYFEYRNTGNQPWYDDTSLNTANWRNAKPTHLATAGPMNRVSDFQSASWPTGSRPSANFSAAYESDGTTLASNQHVVQPGQIAKFSFTIQAPTNLQSGVYREHFEPIIEGTGGLLNHTGTWGQITVLKSSFSDTYYGQSSYSSLNPGTSSPAYFMYRNTGNSPWYDDTSLSSAPAGTHPVHLATSGPINRCSRFGSSWVGCARPAVNFSAVYESDGTTLASNQHVVQPGQIAKFSFSFTAPLGTLAGTYRENFRPILEGTSDGGLNDPGTFLFLTVKG